MKLSKETISILKSLSGINTGMVVPAGNTLQVESEPKDIFVKCEIEEEFDTEFAIYDMPSFINTIGLFEDSELDFQTDYVNIKSGRNQCDYYYTDKSFITHGDWLDIKDDMIALTFDLTNDDISNIQKASSIMGLDQLEFTNKDGKMVCDVVSKSGDSMNRYGIEMGDCDKTLDFKLVMRIGENFRFYSGDYQIQIAKIGGTLVFCANNTSLDLKYQIAMDRDSYYND